MGNLVLVRHGQSVWNLANRFTGWVDVPLSTRGIYEALMAAEDLKQLGVDIAFTSTLTRAQQTLLLIFSKQQRTGIFIHDKGKQKTWSEHKTEPGKNDIPIIAHQAINERYYGNLQGLNKDAARKKWGEEQVHKWRRSWDIRPPGGESLKDTYKRSVKYFNDVIMTEVKKGKDVLVSAHGNSLRAIIKYLDGISNEDIPNLELPTGKPIVYEYSRGKLKAKHKFSFGRPTYWKPKHAK